MRRYFADLLAILSNRYQLCPTARHLAVYLLDLFMDHYDVAVKQLYVIGLSCLLLASESPPLSLSVSQAPLRLRLVPFIFPASRNYARCNFQVSLRLRVPAEQLI